jgi:hypothetical protein
MSIGGIAGLVVGLLLLGLALGAILVWFFKIHRKKLVSVSRSPSEHLLEEHTTWRSPEQYSATQYSLLGAPTRPLPVRLLERNESMMNEN